MMSIAARAPFSALALALAVCSATDLRAQQPSPPSNDNLANAAAVSGVEAGAGTQWLSLAGRAWFEAGEFDAASDCYLAAVRRRVAASSPT